MSHQDPRTLKQPLHLGRLTWNLQITHLERKMIFQTSLIMVHVHFPRCISWFKYPPPGCFFIHCDPPPWQVDSPEQLGSAREILLAMENAAGVVSILVTGPDKVWEISEKDNVTGDESSMWGAVIGGVLLDGNVSSPRM